MSTVKAYAPHQQQQQRLRPQRAPVLPSPAAPPLSSTRSYTPFESTQKDTHLEAVLENRRRNGLPLETDVANERRRPLNETQAEGGKTIAGVQMQPGKEATSYAVSVETWDNGAAAKATEGKDQAEQPMPQRNSLMPLSNTTTISRMTSTRRYMDQLDDEEEDEEDEEEEEKGNHASWQSGMAGGRDASNAGNSHLDVAPTHDGTRSSTASALSFESRTGDGFHYSMYGSLPATEDEPLPSMSVVSPEQSHPLAPTSVESTAQTPETHPVVRIGPPSPTTDTFLDDPRAAEAWNVHSPPSTATDEAFPTSASTSTLLTSSPTSSQTRARSQTVSKNFSRPFLPHSAQPPPLPTPSSTSPLSPAAPSRSPPTSSKPLRPLSPRSDSLESSSSRFAIQSHANNPLDRKSSLGANSSSLEHSHEGSSSQGGHSMSSSWEDRRFQGMRQHEEARRAIMLAREQSQRNRAEHEMRNSGIEELHDRGIGQENLDGVYGGEAEEEVWERRVDAEPSIHFPAFETKSSEISPSLPYDAEPHTTASFDDSPTIDRHLHSSHNDSRVPPSPTFSPRPAPAVPSGTQTPYSLPLPLPSPAPSFRRRPSDSPSFASHHSPVASTYRQNADDLARYEPEPSASSSTRSRNVLRKPRPSRREEDQIVSSSMSRTGSAASGHSQTSKGETSQGPWARFRSRSKSRSRAASTVAIEEPLPSSPLPSLPVSSPPRHFGLSASLPVPASPYQPSRSLFPTTSPLPSPSSSSPLSQADFARLQASRPAFLRSKTSTGNVGGGVGANRSTVEAKEWVLKSVAGVREVQNGLVQSGEAASIYGEGDGDNDIERLEDRTNSIGLGRPRKGSNVSAVGSTSMGRSVSDQGPSTQPWTTASKSLQGDHGRSPSGGGNSLYSDYSYYDLPPSPFDPASTVAGSSPLAALQNGSLSRTSTLQKAKQEFASKGNGRGKMMRTPSGNERRADPVTPDDFLQLGIEHHEGGDLSRAAWCFEQSARKDGGCGGGMLMWGLTLRHGWGCQVNAPVGFRYLQMAAESVVEDLDRVVFGGRTLTESEANTKAAKSELVLALHEIGVSYRFGWGIEKNKKMAVSYFTLSADLGDIDAQQDVAFCYANGKGCKKDLKKAAKYYRMAIAGGAPDWGLSWVNKPKYMDN